MMKKFLYLTAVVFLLSSCTLYKVESEDISTEYLPSKASINDVAYVETVDQAHQVIGTVLVNAERRQNISEVIERMKREAALIGGDAITDVQTDATGDWKKMPAQKIIGNGYIRAAFTAKVIVFK